MSNDVIENMEDDLQGGLEQIDPRSARILNDSFEPGATRRHLFRHVLASALVVAVVIGFALWSAVGKGLLAVGFVLYVVLTTVEKIAFDNWLLDAKRLIRRLVYWLEDGQRASLRPKLSRQIAEATAGRGSRKMDDSAGLSPNA